jgi:hypothetical protein
MASKLYDHTLLPDGFKVEVFTNPDRPNRPRYAIIDTMLDADITDWYLKENKAIEKFFNAKNPIKSDN